MVPGEQVRTGEKSKVILELSDATLTTVGPDSQLAIEEIVPLESEEGFTAFETVVRVVQGLGLFEIKDSKNARSFSVKTPYAVVVHRGTVFTVEVAHDGGKPPSLTSKRDGFKDITISIRLLSPSITVRVSVTCCIKQRTCSGRIIRVLPGAGFVPKHRSCEVCLFQ